MSKHHKRDRNNMINENNNINNSNNGNNNNGNANNNPNNNPLVQMLNGNSANPLMGLLSSFLGVNSGGSNNMLEGLLSSLGGKDNNILGNLMGSLGGQDNDILGNLMGSLGGQDNNILANLMSSLGGQGSNMPENLTNGASSASNVKKNSNKKVNVNNDIVSSKEDEQDNTLSNIFSGMGNIDLSEISNMLSGIDLSNLDLNNSNLSDMMDSISNDNSFEDNNPIQNNDVEFKHTSPKENTHNILEALEDEEKGQLIYILAHLVDEKKLETLNRIVEGNSSSIH